MGYNSALPKKPAHPAGKFHPLISPAGITAIRLTDGGVAAQENPSPASIPKEETRSQKRRGATDDFEQYALTAKGNGWYPCLHSRRINFYLKAGEVWKYGVAGSGEFGRFKATFLLRNKVSCIIQYRGPFAQCLRQEQIRLFNYPNLPENLARPPARQLPRPPYNPIVPPADVFNR